VKYAYGNACIYKEKTKAFHGSSTPNSGFSLGSFAQDGIATIHNTRRHERVRPWVAHTINDVRLIVTIHWNSYTLVMKPLDPKPPHTRT
jgi:hypothetical protein